MKKRLTVCFLAMLLLVFGAIPALADGEETGVYDRLIDEAGLLSESEQRALLDRLDSISEYHHVDVTVITVTDMGDYSASQDFADDLFEYCGYGFNESRDGILLMIATADRDYAYATHGYAITAFTDAGLEYIDNEVRPYLSDEDYASAFNKYADLCDEFLTQARTDRPYDYDTLPHPALSPLWILLSIGTGLFLASLVVGGMKSKLKTVRSQAAADNYVRDGSMDVTVSRDLFLYRSVARTAKPKDTDSHSGSTTHTSSSGSTFGGRSGKY